MSRTVNQTEHTHKRSQILDVAQRLIYTKGYEGMTIQDIRGELGMSNGAFFHYFNSKQAILTAFIQQLQEEVRTHFLPVVGDAHLSALEKLQSFFTVLNGWRLAHKLSVIELLKGWYTDGNALIREKVNDALREQQIPLLNTIVQQGIDEGLFTTSYPQQAADIIIRLMQSMETTHAKLLLSSIEHDEDGCIRNVVATHSAYMETLERMLGIPNNSLHRIQREMVKVWITALHGQDHPQER
jgi:AcrR family transcriptional regulator